MLEGSILAQLVQNYEAHTPHTQPLSFGVYYKHTLVALCHALEDCVLAPQPVKPLMVTAFQQGKWYLEEADRYGEIAEQADQVVIMAAPSSGFHDHPTSQRSNVALVDLADGDPVGQEWHLIILSPNYAAMVLCQELTAEEYGAGGVPDRDLARKFYGLWTFEPELVMKTMELAAEHIGTYNPELQAQLQAKLTAITTRATTPEHTTHVLEMESVAGQVVQYLQASRSNLGQTTLLESPEPAMQHNLVSNELQAFLRLSQLVDLGDPINPGASAEVAALTEMMGQLVDLPAWQLKRLRLASLLYRISPIQPLDAQTLDGPSCPLHRGAQVLRTMPRLRAVAQIITHQSEWWDGSGQPAQLSGDQIPVESRILGLVATFQQLVAELRHQRGDAADIADCLADALEHCRSDQGVRWDPKLVELLELMITGLQQGLSLPNIPPRLTMGAGLLDPEVVA